ncbi:unnamed protein product [Rotaria magnacalcarata]|uniref:HTH CENPB-type domain-containing protein n=1 Tax=Rotaria magnacalcarata TaxID=392030 RepID=A0A816MJF6_9BILA|nr:unnamed protein product [Rotaria magnacalcarata]CAF2072733.1 unnamed protein product [Rotaria magnacalcarata]
MSHRKALTLEEKIALIKDNQNAHGLSVRELADNYKISKSSAANILRRSEELLADYSSNCNKGIKRKLKDENRQKIDELVFEWFTQQRAKQIPISGPILQETARQVAEQLGYTSETFKASNGWLEKFHNRHAISFRTINGESALVDNSTVEERTQRLSTILDGFDENNVFNADEMGLSDRATPDRSLVLSKEECKENTIKNDFRAAGFVHSSTPSSSMMNMDIIVETDIELNNSDNPLQQLHSLLIHLRIGGSQ